jgi:hypothetical protein
MDSAENKQLEILKKRIKFDKNIFQNNKCYEEVLNNLLEDSKYLALSLRYPYKDFSQTTLPEKYKNWQIRCCVEIYQSLGTEGIKSYSENGLNWTRDSGYLSKELREEIEPMVGYIKEEAVEDVQSSK